MNRNLISCIAMALVFSICFYDIASARPGGGGGRRGGAGRASSGAHRAGGQVSLSKAGSNRNLGNHNAAGGRSQLGKAGVAGGNASLRNFSGNSPRQLNNSPRQLKGGAAGSQQLQGFLNMPTSLPNGQPSKGAFADKANGWKANNPVANSPKAQQVQGSFDKSQFQSQAQQLQQNAQSAINDWQSGPEPFSPAWYVEHPQAWQVTHPYADVWAATTLTAATAWLGYPYYGQPAYGSGSTVVYESTTEVVESTQPTPAEPVAPVANDAGAEPEWLSLGVFAISSAKKVAGADSQQLLQLSVSKEGWIRGTYYDAKTGKSSPASGSIERTTQLVSFNIDSQPGVTFSTPLETLTSPQGTLLVTKADGKQETWVAAHLEQPAPAGP